MTMIDYKLKFSYLKFTNMLLNKLKKICCKHKRVCAIFFFFIYLCVYVYL